MMNDDLVYALIALGLYWWTGWLSIRCDVRHARWKNARRNLGGEMVLVGLVLLAGGFLGIISWWEYGLVPRLKSWYDSGGRIFGDKEKKNDEG